MRSRALVVLVSFVLPACASSPPPPPAASAPPPPAAAEAASAPAAASSEALPFIEDDYARALAAARAANKPLFVDAWAPWCHSCLSMRAYTFREAKVRAHAGDFVWASIDTENAKNAAWVDTHPTHAMPTLFVVDPKTGGNVLEWPSSATADELVKLLDQARAAMVKGRMEWPSEGVALEAKLDGLMQKKSYAECAEVGDREVAKLAKGAGRPITIALACASELPPGEARAALVGRMVTRGRAIAADATDAMLPDDRSSLYEEIVGALDGDGKDVNKDAEKKEVARTWAAFLESEAKRAPDAEARAVFDAHRVDAYVALGEPERALPMLEQSVKDFPKDYNPPARMARAYFALKKYDQALAWMDRALPLAYGPRTLGLLGFKAQILESRGDRAGAAATLREALRWADAQKLTPRYAPVRADLERRLKTLEANR